MAEHNDLGKAGEEAARIYLQEKGYKIRHTNWIFGKLELDIIAEKDEMLVVVEVKSRSSEYFEHPKDAITPAKIRRIVNAAHEYLQSFSVDLPTRFDVVAALHTKSGSFKIEHLEDAFMAPVN